MGARVGHSDGGEEDYTPLIPQMRVRIGVECASVDEFVVRYGRFLDGDRIFIATDAVEPPGSLVQFRVDLADGRIALHGTGTVIEARAQDAPGMPRGMLLRFVALDEASARVVEAMGAPPRLSAPATVLPANPFGDVSEAAIAYFVDWSLERNGSLALRRGPAAVSFSAVRMAAPRRRRWRPPAWLPFVVGLATGGLGIAALIHATREIDRALDHHARPAPPPIVTPLAPSAPSPPARTVTPVAADDGDAPLSIAADPGASVTVDGRRVGHTPLLVRVTRGPHVVELARPRYQTARLDVDAPGRANARLERPRATLHVTSNAADAEVLVDGDDMGRAPVSAEVAGYERCKIEVRASDGRTWKRRVYVKPPLTDLAATFSAE
jgi:hypothetical protein